jgi:hypothetical protein
MSLTLLVIINVIADAAILGVLALTMSAAGWLKPHRPAALLRFDASGARHAARRHQPGHQQRPLVRR